MALNTERRYDDGFERRNGKVMALNANEDAMMALNAETGNVTPNVNLGSEYDGSER